MPIYEYQCTSSGERFEVKQKISDPPIQTCDQLSCSCAQGQPVTKMISAPAIMFKGSGWYVTDYSDKLKEPGTKSENKGQPAETKSTESKSENTPTTTQSESASKSSTAASSTPSAGSSGSGTSSTSGSSSAATSGAGTSTSTGKSS